MVPVRFSGVLRLAHPTVAVVQELRAAQVARARAPLADAEGVGVLEARALVKDVRRVGLGIDLFDQAPLAVPPEARGLGGGAAHLGAVQVHPGVEVPGIDRPAPVLEEPVVGALIGKRVAPLGEPVVRVEQVPLGVPGVVDPVGGGG